MKRLNILLCTLLFTLVFFGCQGIKEENSSKSKIEPKQELKRIVVLGIDETGSYGLWEQAKSMVVRIIEQLRPGDIFYCRSITDASYLDKYTIFRLEIPFIEETENENPFDRKSKNLHRSQVFQNNLLKREACSRLAAVRYTNAKKTDIYGFLSAASDRFNLAPKGSQRILIVASDLKDNVGYSKIKLDLSGVQVAIIGFQSSKDPIKTRRLKNKWIKRLTQAGAVKVVFLSVEEKLTMDLFQGA